MKKFVYYARFFAFIVFLIGCSTEEQTQASNTETLNKENDVKLDVNSSNQVEEPQSQASPKRTVSSSFGPDIIGLKLAMTEAEVKDVLNNYGVDPNIQEYRKYFNYSDGVNHNLKTDDFIFYLEGFKPGDNSDSISVFFSPGPMGGKVTAIIRTVENRTNPPIRSQYVSGLKNKYGQTTSEDISTLHWDFPAGKTQCIVGRVGGYLPTQPSILKNIYGANVGSRDATFHYQNIKSLSECASYLTYAMPSGDDSPVTTAKAVMVDVAGTADGELSANEWVSGLAEQARKAREAKGSVPVF